MFQRLCHLYRTSMTRVTSNKRSTMNQANAQKVLRFCRQCMKQSECTPDFYSKTVCSPFACTGQEQHAAAGGRSKSGLEGI